MELLVNAELTVWKDLSTDTQIRVMGSINAQKLEWNSGSKITLSYSVVKIARLNDELVLSTELKMRCFQLEANLVNAQSLLQKDKKKRKRKRETLKNWKERKA